MFFMGFTPKQIVKAVEYFNLHHETVWDPYEVIGELGDPVPARVIEAITFWKTKRPDMPGEIEIAKADGFFGRK